MLKTIALKDEQTLGLRQKILSGIVQAQETDRADSGQIVVCVRCRSRAQSILNAMHGLILMASSLRSTWRIGATKTSGTMRSLGSAFRQPR